MRLLRCARNDKMIRHCEERSDEAISEFCQLITQFVYAPTMRDLVTK